MRDKFDLKKALIVSLVALGFIVLATYCVEVTGSRDALRDTLASTQDTLIVAQAELVSVHSELASTETELASARTELTSVTSDLASTETELMSTQNTLVATEGTLVATEAELVSVQDNLASTQGTLISVQQQLSEATQKLKVAQETLAGLGVTLSTSDQNYDADLVDNPNAVNPSWDELVGFLYDDQTEYHEYVADVYDCSEFSRDIHNNAEATGIRSAVIHVDFSNTPSRHALNAFLTTDYGLVYIDCTEPPDVVVHVEKGEECWMAEVGTFSPENVRDQSWWSGQADAWWDWLWWDGPTSDCFPFIDAGYSGYVIAITSDIRIFW